MTPVLQQPRLTSLTLQNGFARARVHLTRGCTKCGVASDEIFLDLEDSIDNAGHTTPACELSIHEVAVVPTQAAPFPLSTVTKYGVLVEYLVLCTCSLHFEVCGDFLRGEVLAEDMTKVNGNGCCCG
jgi:hypothetical protein